MGFRNGPIFVDWGTFFTMTPNDWAIKFLTEHSEMTDETIAQRSGLLLVDVEDLRTQLDALP